ncbi:hypothetical protein G9F72_019240 [Clostridium estertheticum]|uniref:hypothetical protein n=1 Tax=Clostridium estertheticum TaxID=238834 RepID=UPI0013E91C50|nr:hypothetical protein [Clostridium estertheticum]MBZ9688468.1 hypothetical protein [Clostridium estertheticum]
MTLTWGDRLPLLYKEFIAGRIHRFDATGSIKELTKTQLKEIKKIETEFLDMKVIGVIDKTYTFNGGLKLHFNDFLLVGTDEEAPFCDTNDQELVYFRSFVKNLTDPSSSEEGDVGIKELNGKLQRVI